MANKWSWLLVVNGTWLWFDNGWYCLELLCLLCRITHVWCLPQKNPPSMARRWIFVSVWLGSVRVPAVYPRTAFSQVIPRFCNWQRLVTHPCSGYTVTLDTMELAIQPKSCVHLQMKVEFSKIFLLEIMKTTGIWLLQSREHLAPLMKQHMRMPWIRFPLGKTSP